MRVNLMASGEAQKLDFITLRGKTTRTVSSLEKQINNLFRLSCGKFDKLATNYPRITSYFELGSRALTNIPPRRR